MSSFILAIVDLLTLRRLIIRASSSLIIETPTDSFTEYIKLSIAGSESTTGGILSMIL